MAQENQKHLARPISAVKKLAEEVKIDSSYYSEIKPFLFGTTSTETIDAENLPSTGIHNKVTTSGILPHNSKDIIVNLEGKGKVELQRADIANEQFIADLNNNKLASDYLFPSDLVSILTSLAKKFYNFEEDFDKSKLQPFVGGDHLTLVKKWGKPQTIEKSDGTGQKDLILERNIFAEDSGAKELLDAVVGAAIAYEQLKKTIDHIGFIHESELKDELAKNLVPNILENFKEYEEKIKDETEEKFTEADKKIKEEIEKIINEDLSFFEKLLTNENLKSFENQEAYYVEQKTFRLSGEGDGVGILETEEYTEFKKEAIPLFLDKHKSSLVLEFIDPLFETAEEKLGDEPTEDDDQEDGGDTDEDQVEENFSINKEQFRQQVVKDLSSAVLNNFINQIEDPRFENFRETFLENKLIEDQIEKLLESIAIKVESYSKSNNFLSTQSINSLRAQNLINIDEVFLNTVFESDWYKNFLNETSFSNFLSTQRNDYFENLFEENILPALNILEGQDLTDAAPDETAPTEPQDPTTAQPTPASDKLPTEPQAPLTSGTLTPDQRKKIQYETAWIYNRAVYEMFTAYGIDTNDINKMSPDLLNKLREDAYKFTSSMDPKDLELMFGSASKRQAALLKFYPEFGSENSAQIKDFYQEFSKSSSFQEISEVQKTNFANFHDSMVSDQVISIISTKDLLKESLKNILDSDSPVLNKNAQNIIDTMIIRYGINQDFFTTDEDGNIKITHGPENKHDVVDAIKKMSAEDLLLILGHKKDKLSNEDLKSLQKILINYTTQRASELTLHIQDTSLSRGLVSVGDGKAINSKLTNNIRISIKTHGAETVAKGMNESPSAREKKIKKINKQYKTFTPLWNSLTAKEQRAVYKKLGIDFNKNADKDTFLELHPAFMDFDITTIKSLNKPKKIKYFTDEQLRDYKKQIEDHQELFKINQQLSEEQQFAEFINAQYLAYTNEEDRLLLADQLNSGVALDSYPDNEFFSRFSPKKLMDADYAIGKPGHEISNANRGLRKKRRFGKLRDRLKKSKLYKRFKKKLDPAKKMAKSLSDAAALKAVSTVANVVAPGLGALVYGMGKKIGAKNTVAIIGTALAFLIAQTIRALMTFWGFIGGVLGGAAGFLIGGPLGVVPGVIAGANAGYLMERSLFSGRNSATAQAALANTSSNTAVAGQASLLQAISTSSGVFFGLPIYLLAPGIATFIAIAATIYTVIIIQSAFLIPLPAQYGSGGGFNGGGGPPVMGSAACFQFAPAGATKIVGLPPQTITSIDWDQASIDMFKAGLSRVASNPKYISLLCKGGRPIATYKFPTSTQGYWGWVSSPNEVVFYGGAFSAGVRGMEYILIHESGHLIDFRNPGIRSGFLQAKTDSSCYTYPFGCNDLDMFAEGLVLYAVSDNFIGNSKFPPGSWGFRSKYPAEYNWFKNNVFGKVEY